MRREMQQLAALVEAAAAGEAWAAEDAPPLPEDRVVSRVILGPSWHALPWLVPALLGGTGLALGGWPAMLLLPTLFALTLGRRFNAWSWRWTDQRTARELGAALPRFARSRLTAFEGGAERIGRLRHAAHGMALGAAPGGAPLLLLVRQGRGFRIPFALIRGWGWRAAGVSQAGRMAPGLEAALAAGPDGLVLLLDDPDWPLLHHPCPEPGRWAAHLPAPP